MKVTSLLALILAVNVAFAQKTKDEVFKSIDSKYDQYTNIAHRIWEFAEVGYQEVKSSELLQETLTKSGFKIEKGVAGIPTAFVATYGSGKPVIAILGEFDALPGVSQDAVPEVKSVPGRPAGHACGHHLFGTASSAAAIAVKDWMIANKKPGTIRMYGTPAEEGGSGKVYMVREGLFSDVDVVLHWHPGSMNSASFGSSLANKSGKFRFTGVASHAAASPERGRSALDAVEAMNNMVNMMREHVPSETRIHYVITRGGEAPNVVPAFAEVYYYVRHPDRNQVVPIWERIVKAAEGAAMGTETKVQYEITGGVYNLLANESLSKVMDNNLRTVGGYTYTEQEKDFAQKIQKTFTSAPPKLESTNTIIDFGANNDVGGSTDVGDVSWVVPTVGLSTATWVPGTAAHSWQAVAAGGTTIGNKGMMIAAKTLAGTVVDLFDNPALIADAKKEFDMKRPADFKYDALVGNRKPALDYRK
ncbi:MAG TPA: M20 family metallopeptidase [Cyclobacteriaceae bacterium]|nr:M20 family metallopeptidase [Cyclobacteriaceae bacterium]